MKPNSRLNRILLATLMAIATSFGIAPNAISAGKAADKLSNRPVIFVHGWHADSKIWGTAISKARSFGYKENELFKFDYRHESNWGNHNTPIESLADELDQFIKTNDLVNSSPDGKIDIVAHSMGGLVARAYLIQGGEETTAHLVTLATPNHGTALGNLCPTGACGTQAAEMAAGSGFLRWLNRVPESYGNTRYATFRSNVGDEPLEAALSPYPYACDKVVYGVDDDGERSARHTGKTSILKGADNFISPCIGHDQIQNDDWTINTALHRISDSDGAHTPKAAQVQCGDLTERWGKGQWPRPNGWVSAHAQSCVVAAGERNSHTRSAYTELQIRGCGYYDSPAGIAWWYAGVGNVNCDVNATGILWRNGTWGAHNQPKVSKHERWLQVRTDSAPADTGSKVAGEWTFSAGVHAQYSSEWDVKDCPSETPSMIVGQQSSSNTRLHGISLQCPARS
ncbi:esterase/lipase family protein [Streptomyces sp. NPDC059080]|uniref:esterase/lipase family protein n=1 Tax=Streptomyces sp. NPDC059080 TaxID=3346718 RepID=UPI0036B1B332